MKHLQLSLWLAAVLLLAGCGERPAPAVVDAVETPPIMQVDSVGGLVVYYPQFTYVDLVCASMPTAADASVVMCVAAAFTGECRPDFSHENIAGQHVASGVFHRGYRCPANTGTFAYYDGAWQFRAGTGTDVATRAADASGMAFEQVLLVHHGASCQPQVGGRDRFRALAEKDGRLCVVEAAYLQDIDTFIGRLLHYGISEAIYLQPGEGWNYSWYRDAAGVVHVMHPKTHDYGTNWLTFYLLS